MDGVFVLIFVITYENICYWEQKLPLSRWFDIFFVKLINVLWSNYTFKMLLTSKPCCTKQSFFSSHIVKFWYVNNEGI